LVIPENEFPLLSLGILHSPKKPVSNPEQVISAFAGVNGQQSSVRSNGERRNLKKVDA
jgi:hypothetical protein